jgi:hypothetical protein
MSAPATNDWHQANQQYLMAALAEVRAALECHSARLQRATAAADQSRVAQQALKAAARALPAPSALDMLCSAFGLSRFERHILLLCAGPELDSSFASLYATAQGDPQRTYPTFSLALAALTEPHWSALTPTAPLRRWRLIEVGAGSALTLSPLRIDESVLHFLVGVPHLDERLVGIVEPLRMTACLVPSYRVLAERVVTAWSQTAGTSLLPIIQLCGDEVVGKRCIAAAACAMLRLNLKIMSVQLIPPGPGELDALLRLWEREAALSTSALLLDCDEITATDAAREHVIARLIEGINGALIVTSRERLRARQRPTITIDVRKPTASEQRTIWQEALGEMASSLHGIVEALVSQFNLSVPTIQAACAEALGSAHLNACSLWEACRVQARPRLDDLAQRIELAATWNDLVLPEPQLYTLREIAAHVRQRVMVYETWGFAAKSARGLGISALFVGVSGTGKTMAAEVLANELQLDLYRIDLSQVVSKYIGETEKNLRRVFDAAEEGGGVLLFDEADALFGKRSDVKDSHDRYANIEVSYLLQRMEAYRGLAILTTNMKSALDTAFLRRLRFVVPFPFPDLAQRTQIWQRVFPPSTPTKNLDTEKLARLNIAGGNIHNIALNAAFLAAEAGEPVGMAHLLRAARSEYAKMEKPLTEAEIGGWV